MARQALVTGATGFIGQHLVARLLDSGWRVAALLRPGASFSELDIEALQVFEGDVTQSDALRAACASGPDAVFHLAANTSTSRDDAALQQKVNVEGTRRLIEAMRDSGSGRLVHVSSVSVHGFSNRVINEQSAFDPAVRWINYCRTKADAEKLVGAAIADGMDAVVVSPAHVMGPWDQNNWIRMIRMIDDGSLPGVPPGSGSFADVREVAAALAAAATRGPAGEKYLLGGPHASFRTLVAELARALEVPLQARPMPGWLLKAVARWRSAVARLRGREPELSPEAAAFVCGHEYCDSTKARQMLDYRETDLKTLVSDTVAWYRRDVAPHSRQQG